LLGGFRETRRLVLLIISLAGEPAHIQAKRSALPVAGNAWRSQMTVIARMLSRAIITFNDVEIFRQLVLFCAASLFVTLLMQTYGVDLSPGFF
jgi:hypothetical protein